MYWIAAVLAVVGGGKGAIANNAKRTTANANLQAAYDQAGLYETRAIEFVKVSTEEGSSVYKEAGQVAAQRNNRFAARNIKSISGIQIDIAEGYEAHDDYRKIVGNAFREASALRTQSRIDTAAAHKNLKRAEDERETDILTGLIGGAASGLAAGG